MRRTHRPNLSLLRTAPTRSAEFLSLSIDTDRLGHMLLWGVQIFAIIMVAVDVAVVG